MYIYVYVWLCVCVCVRVRVRVCISKPYIEYIFDVKYKAALSITSICVCGLLCKGNYLEKAVLYLQSSERVWLCGE